MACIRESLTGSTPPVWQTRGQGADYQLNDVAGRPSAVADFAGLLRRVRTALQVDLTKLTPTLTNVGSIRIATVSPSPKSS